ncbi:MAG: toluene monooxygenase [Gammaproteobacteria bacterium]
MKFGPATTKQLKTWQHLQGQKRKPTEYEIVSVNYHYPNLNAGQAHYFESIAKDAPLNQWYTEYLDSSPLRHPNWADFRDPDETTYRSYNVVQDGQEKYVEELFDRFNADGHDFALTPAWVNTLARLYTPARYVFHALQMDSAYGASITPTSQVSICFALQAADCLRWLSHIAYRTAELALHCPDAGFNANELARWQTDPAWQGFREMQEKCLSTYDWGEHFVALNLVAKPAVEEAILRQMSRAARAANDMLLALVIESEWKDVERHRRWTLALVRFILQEPANRAHVARWIDKWTPLADAAIEAYCNTLGAPADAAREATRQFRALALTVD